MNAILRNNCEALVLTNEAIEVHLSYLRPAVDALGVEVKALGTKLNEMSKTIDQHDKENIERVSKLQASFDGLKWFLSSAAVIASGVSIAHSLGWI